MSEHSLLYDELPFWSAAFGLTLLDTVRYKSGINVLDIGSGSGFPMLELAGRLDGASRVYGLDILPEMVVMVNEKISLRGIRNAEAIVGSAESMPFPDSFFDLIISNNGLNNVSDQKASLKECLRVSKPGAQMILTMNLPHTMHEFYELLREVLEGLGRTDLIRDFEHHIGEKRKPVEYLKQIILETGFDIRSINLDGFKYRFASSEAFFSHYLISRYFKPHWDNLLPLEIINEVYDQVGTMLDRKEVVMTIPFVCFDCSCPG